MAPDSNAIIEKEIIRNRNNSSIFNDGSEIAGLAEKPIETSNKNLKHLVSIKGDDRYSVRSFLVVGNDVYMVTATGIFGEQVRSVLRENEVISSFIRRREESDIPGEEGVCIDGAFMNQNPTYENIELGVRLEEFPDVHLSISLTRRGNYAEPQEMFLKRHAEALADGRKAGFGDWLDRLKYLRKTQRQVGGWGGDEVLIKFPAWKEAKEGHQFVFWSTGKPNDPFHPNVDIKLDTGVKGNEARSVPASLTDEEAVALWDRLLNSIRVRPVKADRKKSGSIPAADVPEIPVGAQHSTDEICPASGWWQCFDMDAIEPSRWFAKGDRFPRVHYRREETWRDKLFDTQQIALGNGIWQLMRHGERSETDSTSAQAAN